MYQVGYVKGEAGPYVFENSTPQKKDKRWDFVKKVSFILSCEKLIQKGLEC